MTKLTAVLIAVVLLALPAHAEHEPPTGSVPAIVADLALVRPLALGLSAASTGLFFGTLGLTFLTGVGDESAYVLLFAPWRFTAARHLGNFHEYRDDLTIYGTARKAL